jgi:hypothetical protein
MPRHYPWLTYQVDLLVRLIEGGTPYGEAAKLCGHSVQSCRTKISDIRLAVRTGSPPKKTLALPKVKRRTALRLRPRQLAPKDDQRANTSTFRYVMDAELRARIELVGITAGLLGDPLPGRSALDAKRAGAASS